MLKYRVNYGNGQVSNTMTLAQCRQHIVACIHAKRDPYADLYVIQQYDPEMGEWFTTKHCSHVISETA